MILKSRYPSYALNRMVGTYKAAAAIVGIQRLRRQFGTTVWAILLYKILIDFSRIHFLSVPPSSSVVRPCRKYSHYVCSMVRVDGPHVGNNIQGTTGGN